MRGAYPMAEDILIGEVRVHVLDSADMTQNPAQAELLEALANPSDDIDPEQVIARLRTREALLALSRSRDNSLVWYDFAPGSSILEICDSHGGATGALLGNARRVTAIVPARANALICAHAHKEDADLEIWAGDLADCLEQAGGPFGYIVIHGVGLQSGPLLERCRGLLAEQGRLLVTADNYMGYRRLATSPVDGSGAFDIFGRAPSRPLVTHARLMSLLETAGLCVLQTWYPHPDRILVRSVFSDARLPAAGELPHHADPSGARNVHVLNEDSILRAFAQEGAFAHIADSFLVEAALEPTKPSPVRFARLSNERRRDLAIATTIDSSNVVHKRALYPEGQEHVQRLLALHEALSEQHEGLFAPNKIVPDGPGGIIAEFIEGPTLEDILVRLVTSGQRAEAEALLAEYRWRLESTATEPFELTDGFLDVFGRQAARDDFAMLEGLPCQRVTDVDLILRNIIIADDTWNVLDCEWTFDFPIPCAFVLWRALFYLLVSKGVQAHEAEYDFYPAWGFGDAEREIFFKMEVSMQQYITNDAESIDTILEESSPQPLLLEDLIHKEEARLKATASQRRGPFSFLRRS